ncbi:hypothetical protein PF005_g7972 [Phytophthora fragariae]|uniref:Uncharacterized protein n=1 Tax=Phytophthora fragariae TaxID=53985 RepID=A0A6A3LLG9_9STRA|nr:hypothetical protein PF003_g33295 [Phytophthora fragariae]KAE8941505.1 hypothetical protein PF009_g8717 [Phytophthora fragariae]KAE9016974.1 hypothetical protein PF011_g6906 [Phytophthora fragariae]KAE9120261.1 hypothetical protein PF007_g8243 [Phytophthora fragariae]KAE9121367.1 hypothetical protein PF010_g7130 [Phytophthora fragariae]
MVVGDAVREEATRVADALCELVAQSLSERQSSIVKEAVSAVSSVYSEHLDKQKDELFATIKHMRDEQRAALAELKAQHSATVADMTERWDAQETAILTEMQLLRDELEAREVEHRNALEQLTKQNSSSRGLQRSPKLRARSRGDRSRSPSRRRGSYRSRSRSCSRPRNYVSPTHSSQQRSSNSTTSPKHRTYRH